jgi:hypothetical protein
VDSVATGKAFISIVIAAGRQRLGPKHDNMRAAFEFTPFIENACGLGESRCAAAIGC